MSDRPGRELPKEYRAIAEKLVDEQGWGYKYGGKHATLYPADRTHKPVIVSTTPTSDPRAFKNFVALVRRAGGIV